MSPYFENVTERGLFVYDPEKAEPIRVLLVDDNPMDRELTRIGVRRVSAEIMIDEVDSADSALSEITDRNYDCVISDYQMPGASGLELLQSLRSRGETIPFIFLTGQGNESLASEALRRGANDYFTKDIGFAHYDRLLNSIRRVVESERAQRLKSIAENRTSESEARLRQIIEQMPFPVHIFLPDGTSRMVNPAFLSLFGMESGSTIVGNYNALNDPTIELLGLRDAFDAAFRGETVSVREVRLRPDQVKGHPGAHIDRELVYEFLLFPVFNGGSVVNQVVLLLNDVTDRTEAVAALSRSEHDFRQLFGEMQAGCAMHEVICDSAGKPVDYRFLMINPAFEALTGLSAENLIGRTVREVMPGVEPVWIERYGAVALTGVPDRFENFSSELGRQYEVRAFSPEKGKFAVLFHDITSQKKAEESARKSEARLRSLYRLAPIGIGIVTNRVITEINDHCCEMLGYRREELLGKPTRILYADEESYRTTGDYLESAMSENCQMTLTISVVRKDGSSLPVRVSFTPVDGNDISAGMTFTAQEVS